MSFQICRLVDWNKCVIFEIFDDLIADEAFYDFGNVANDQYWPEIIFIISFTFIL